MSDTNAPPKISAATRTVEEVIDDLPRLGISRVGWVVLAIGFFFGIYEAAMIALALPSLQLGLGVTTLQLTVPIAVNAIGFAIGAYVVGIIADRRGRQVGLRITFTVFAIGALACALAWNVPSLSVARFIVGCGMGAVVALATLYLGEVSARSQRGRQVAVFILVGTVLVALSSIAALPVLHASPANGWRFLLGFPVIVIIIVAFINKRHIVESPRWLVEHGRLDEAIEVVKGLDQRARRGKSELAGVTIVDSPRLVSVADTAKPVRLLFSNPRLRVRIIIVTLAVLFFYTAFFGLSTYLTTFLIRTGIPEERALSIVAISRVAPIVSAIAIVFIIERIERRIIVAACIALIAIGVALMAVGHSAGTALVGAIFASLATGVIAPTLYTFIAEIFPTDVRATGTSIADGVGRLGGVIAPFVFVPILFGAGAIAGGGFLVGMMVVSLLLILIGLPINTKGRSLEDSSS